MQLKFKVISGPSEGQEFVVPPPKFLIGRSPDCHLRPKSDEVSRHHCIVMVDTDYAGVRDFGSRNGTYVNGERVEEERELVNGDVLQVGPLKFGVELVFEDKGRKKPKVKDVSDAVGRAAQGSADLDELDVADWLAEEDAPQDKEARDTKELRLADLLPSGAQVMKGGRAAGAGDVEGTTNAAAAALRKMTKKK